MTAFNCPGCGVPEGQPHQHYCPIKNESQDTIEIVTRGRKQKRPLTPGERELVAVALDEYASNCALGIADVLKGIHIDFESIIETDRAYQQVAEDIHHEVKHLRKFRQRATALANFIRRNEVTVACWIQIPEQL